jgi:Ca-activated chloride channel family protein
MSTCRKLCLGWIAGCLMTLGSPLFVAAQVIIIQPTAVVVPPVTPPVTPPGARLIPPRPTPLYTVKQVEFAGTIRDQAASLQLTQVFQNTGSGTLEAQLLFPMADAAAISGLTLIVDGKELTGKLLPKDDARRIYESIVRQRKDPALLEYVGQGLFQTSVFPIPPGAERRVEIRYSQLLKRDSGLVELLLPLGMARHHQQSIGSVTVRLALETTEPIKTLFSPTHALEVERTDDRHAVVKLALVQATRLDDLKLLIGTASAPVGLSVVSYKPQANEDGYFCLLASPEWQPPAEAQRIPRTLLFVFDRSGSMSGQKFDQAKAALKFLVQQLKDDDLFNIVAYDSAVEVFRPELQRGDDAGRTAALGFVEGLYSGGSTNISGAFEAAFKLLHDNQRPTYLLFMTDGLPTVGELRELPLAGKVRQANTLGARLFSFGVGYDVNSRLLDRFATENRGQSIYVRPNENIEAAIAGLYNKVKSPALTDISLAFEFDHPAPPGSAASVNRAYPKRLTDLYHGEQLVYVGRYGKGGTAKVTLSGKLGDQNRQYVAPIQFAETSAGESNAFVERLWAQRRIGEIIDELDLNGQNQELVNELVQLSLKHGILTPYTSFLADETATLGDRVALERRALSETDALSTTNGVSGFAQRDLKQRFRAGESVPSFGGGAGGAMPRGLAAKPGAGAANAAPAAGQPVQLGVTIEKAQADGQRKKIMYAVDKDGEVREVDSVRQIGTKTFYRRQNVWYDAPIARQTPAEQQALRPERIAQFSKEYFYLVDTYGGEVAKYLGFEEAVVLELGGRVYQIDPASGE